MLVPPTMLRMRPREIISWMIRKYLMPSIEVPRSLTQSTLIEGDTISSGLAKGMKDASTYNLDSIPRVASNKGEIPIESMMEVACNKPVEWSVYVKS